MNCSLILFTYACSEQVDGYSVQQHNRTVSLCCRIKTKRKNIPITQEKMAELLDVSVGYVSQIERGYAKPNLEMLASIAGILNCDITELISNVIKEKDLFLNGELDLVISNMDSRQKQMLLDIAEIIKKN